ncbi:MAG: hypothetical protein A3B38_02255 [Candidatus Levybacteria bacterium RIFCSPLOWO2_01_FULL_36_13]|nr:MAG: hypothetical protein A2684_03485 [Candidatus Levybacteria bacterium RIFCSPHIGHO2_01_FULL_36_15b]OGH35684.1 MAG: hypothetical protein A3B38_02255 [Candidatus Levybacteria bacterium RIFCSPLOWO2_01_FULL_36_13]
MKKLKKLWPYILIGFIVILFFHPLFKGYIPFPGDLLVGEYSPYSSNSYFGIAPGGVPNKGQGFDIIRMTFPWKEFAINSLATWQIPLWNPYNFSGTPFMPNFQSGFFYPFNLLLLIFGIIPGWAMYIIAQPILAGIFTFLFLRQNNLYKVASIFGAITFAFSSYMVVWLQYGIIGHAVLWLPIILFLIDKNIKKLTISTSFLLILSLTLSILAGYIQVSIYVFIFSFTYLIYKIISEKKKLTLVLNYLPVFILPLFLSAFQLLPTFDLFSQSARSSFSIDAIKNLLIPLYHTVTTFVPDFFGNPATRNYWLNGTYIERVTYIGVLPLIFIFISFFQKKFKPYWFFFAWAFFVYIFTLNTPFGLFINSLHIPFISTGVPTRIIFLFSFSASVLSAMGLNIWLKERKIVYKPLVIVGFIYLSLWIFVFIAPYYLKYPWISDLLVSKKNLILPSSIFILSLLALIPFRKYKNIATIFLIIIVFDLFYFFNKITPFSPAQFFYPQTKVVKEIKNLSGIDRSWGYGSGYIETNFQTHEKIYSAEGYDPLIIKRYMELVTMAKDGKILKTIPRSDVNISQGGKSLGENVYRKELLDLLGIKYITFKDNLLSNSWQPNEEVFPKDQYSLIWQDSPWQIYENKDALPRFFITSDYIVVSKNKALEKIYDKSLDLRKTLILEKSPSFQAAFTVAQKANLVSYSPNKIVIQALADKPSLLFLSDNYYNEWEVKIDGNKKEILIANYSFRAVEIPKGNHKVEFYYNPKSFKLGLGISALSLIFLVSFVGYNNVRFAYARKNSIIKK